MPRLRAFPSRGLSSRLDVHSLRTLPHRPPLPQVSTFAGADLRRLPARAGVRHKTIKLTLRGIQSRIVYLLRFYPPAPTQNESAASAPPSKLPRGSSLMSAASTPQKPNGFGVTEITSDPDGAEIFLDEKFVGTTPATLRIAEGPNTLALKSANHADWTRSITILKDSTVTVKATFDPN